MRKAFIATAALVSAVAVFLAATLPPPPVAATEAPDPALARLTVAGAYHIHTTRSDGAGGRDEVAAAASRAGLRFVIFTDHGDGSEPTEPPEYRHGVLCLDGVEISTNGGHYVALGMEPAPYPLGGEADAVVEDVRRLGGFGVAAHPDSEKAGLRWSGWSLPVDGFEWFNADSEWRDEPVWRLARVPFDYLFRPAGALASMLDRPVEALRRWDRLAAERQVVALAGHDAHGGVAARQEGEQRFGRLGIPSYEASFKTFALLVLLAEPLDGDAPADARRLLQAIRAGRLVTAITAMGRPAWLDFSARQSGVSVESGGTVRADLPAGFVAKTPRVTGSRTVLVCNGDDVESSPGDVEKELSGPGACRVEVRLGAAPGVPPMPWIVSNPIYRRAASEAPASAPTEIVETTLPLDSVRTVVEKDSSSAATVKLAQGGVALDFQLAAGARVSQYVALAAPLRPPLPPFDRIVLTTRASRPLRLSVQLRFDDSRGARWGASVYVPLETVRLSVPLVRLTPFGPGSATPDWSRATGVLLVIDLTNAHPGFAGRLEIFDLALARSVRP